MKRIILAFLLFVFTYSFSQTHEKEFSLVFNEASILEVINSIETTSDYHFYYIEDWFKDYKVSATYNELSIHQLLNELFNQTLINYYITKDNKIILTKNNIIYDTLPYGYFYEDKKITSNENTQIEKINTPVFVNDASATKIEKIETIRIGKEVKNNSTEKFNLNGKVINAINKEPIADLAIIVDGNKIGAVTNNSGEYSLNISNGLHIIETKSLAFEEIKKRIIIYSDGTLNFQLNESFEGLEEVVINANIDKNVKEVAIGKTAINVEKSKNIPLVLGERDIFKVAMMLPGVASTGEGAAGYNVRGGKTDQNLILLDNATVYNPSHFFGIFSAVNPYTTDDVTIYKGNIPAQYGGRLSSVFDIISKKANLEKFKGEASIGPVTSNLALEIPIVKDTSALLIGGRGTYSNWILKKLDRDELKKSKASYYDIIAKYDHKINQNNELSVSGYYSRDAFSITSDSLYSYSNRLVSLQWKHNFNKNHKADFIITNSDYMFNIDYEGSSNRNFKLDYSINETQLKSIFNYKLNKEHTFNYGISAKHYSVSPGNVQPLDANSIVSELNIPKEKALETALFVSDEYKVNDQLSLDIGLRYSFYAALGKSSQRLYENNLPKNESTFIGSEEYGNNEIIETYNNPEVRVAARYSILPDLSIKASYNNSYQYIHSLSNNTTVSPTDTWKLSDLNIKPQKSNQYTLGLFKNFKDNLYEVSLEGYYKQMDNVLDYKVGAQLLLNETIETDILQGKGKSYGLEFLVKKASGKWNGWLGYTYSRSFVKLQGIFPEEIVNNGDYFPSNYDKPHDVSLVLNYKVTKRLSFSSNVVYQTGRPVTVPVGSYFLNNAEYVLYSDRNQYRIPDYYRLDVSINLEGTHKLKKLAHSYWNLSIYNVLGKNNPYSVFFVTENGDVKAYQSTIFSVPIPTLTYNFKF